MFSKKLLVVGAVIGLNVIVPAHSLAQNAAAPVTLETAQTAEEKQAAIDLMIEAAGGDSTALTSVVESIARSAPEMSAYAAGKAVTALKASMGEGPEFVQAAESIASAVAVVLAADVTSDNARAVQDILNNVADQVAVASEGTVTADGAADAMIVAVAASGSTAVTAGTFRNVPVVEARLSRARLALQNVGLLRLVVTPPPQGSENSAPVSPAAVSLGVI